MNELHKSSSHEQMRIEDIVFAEMEHRLQTKLDKNPKVYFSDNNFTYIQPDFYSKEKRVVGEIFAHIGKNKTGQVHKISNDILKMLLLEKSTGMHYRKMIVVCDESEIKQLSGKSMLAEAIRQFNIELVGVEIGDENKNRILCAQDKQKMQNA